MFIVLGGLSKSPETGVYFLTEGVSRPKLETQTTEKVGTMELLTPSRNGRVEVQHIWQSEAENLTSRFESCIDHKIWN